MTVPYNSYVSSARGLGNFHRLLLLWRGSIYKLVLPELLIYMIVYFFISFLYRFYFKYDPAMKLGFEQVVSYCHHYGNLIPLSFVLGFFVTLIVNRWFSQFMAIPWPDSVAAVTSACIKGDDERGKLLRRSLIRYVNLSFTLTMVMMSSQAKKRFPTMNHFVEAGLMMEHEKQIIEIIYSKTKHPAYWVPLVWAANIASRSRYENRVTDEQTYNILIKYLCNFRSQCARHSRILMAFLNSYDWICVPLVYTQVVTLAVYLYFVSTLMGQQFIDNGTEIDLFFPFFNFLEFFFYMGWLKVAETLINPFGEDDDDFEINWLIDRNFQVGYLIVDQLHGNHPELVKDKFWDKTFVKLPYTAAALRYKTKGPIGSAQYVEVSPEKAKFIYKEDKVSDASLGWKKNSKRPPQPAPASVQVQIDAISKDENSLKTDEIEKDKSGSKKPNPSYWGDESTSKKDVDFSQFMEKDHQPYDPKKDEPPPTATFPYKVVRMATKRSVNNQRSVGSAAGSSIGSGSGSSGSGSQTTDTSSETDKVDQGDKTQSAPVPVVVEVEKSKEKSKDKPKNQDKKNKDKDK